MRKNIALLLGLTLGFTAISCSLPFSRAAAAGTTNKVSMYRLYNPYSGEHFYTCDGGEKTNLVNLGWRDEGIGWIAPSISDSPVFRLYNENSGDHHYTLDVNEKNILIGEGWKYEGIGWYSDDKKTVPLYREYNANAVTGTHNYTASKVEHVHLVTVGWKDEGIGWYAIETKSLEIGDTVLFGAYEQDDISSNGKEGIEWVVLAKEGNKALVISKYVLDRYVYNLKSTDVTWETCSLRKWLNGTFINDAFSTAEQNMIQTTTVTADKNPSYSTPPGNNTKDKVFLLSITEAYKYFSSDEARKCESTEYSAKNTQVTIDVSYPVKGLSNWWLRTPGCASDMAAVVGENGIIYGGGGGINKIFGGLRVDSGYADSHSTVGVRPAMWIVLGS